MSLNKMGLATVLVAASLLIAAWYEYAILEAFLWMNTIALSGLILGRIILAKSGKSSHSNNPAVEIDTRKKLPKVSIHLMTCAEPVEVLRATVQAVMRQSYPNWELILLSNNSTEESHWKPIERWCRGRDERIKFRHRDHIPGYKAGALNFAMELTAKDAELIFVLDADYILNKTALEDAILAFKEHKADLIQFPQAYHLNPEKPGLRADFRYYFSCFSRGANRWSAALPTGTLSLVRKAALQEIGGWPTTSITEDAHLGLHLINAGLRTHYVPDRIGRGLMPATQRDLHQQRGRWIFGNFQCLIQSLRISGNNLPQKLIVFLQLTAWLNFLGIPLIAAALLVLRPEGNITDSTLTTIGSLVAANILIHLTGQWTLFGIANGWWTEGHIKGWIVHLGTSFLGAFHWWTYFINSRRPFRRTNKFQSHNSWSPRQIAGGMLIGLMAILANPHSYVAAFALGLFAFLLLTAQILIYHELKQATPQFSNVPQTKTA